MNFIECRQGTPEWHQHRLGLITASCFSDAVSTTGALTEQQQVYVDAVRLDRMSNKDAALHAGYKAAPTAESIKRALKGEDPSQPSDTALRYAEDLAVERVARKVFCEPPKTWLLDRGHEMEDRARRRYEVTTGAYVTEAGICVEGGFGYSTDGLVEDDGLIEIKAPIDTRKLRAMWLTGDVSEYMHQIQGGMWLTGRKWCDFIMYFPVLDVVRKDMYIKRIFRDDAFIDAMVARLTKFEAMVLESEQFWRA